MGAVSLRLPDDVSQRLQQLAERTGRTKTFYMIEAIRVHLADLEDLYLAEQRLLDLRAGKSQSLFLKSSGGDFRRHTWSLAPSDPSHHEPTSGQLHPGHRTCHSPLYVLGKTTAASHPREGSLHYPTT